MKTILTRFSSDSWDKLKGKQNHNSLFDCQAYYKYATLKSALSPSTNLNKYKNQGKQWLVLQLETEETSYSYNA